MQMTRWNGDAIARVVTFRRGDDPADAAAQRAVGADDSVSI